MTDEPPESIRQRLLDAALEAATMHGITKLSMGDVARRAGLSRQTLYRYFPSKDALIAAVVGAQTTDLIGQVVGAAATIEDPRRSLEAALVTALRLLRDHPLLDRLLTTEPEALLPLLTTEGSPAMIQVRAVVELLVAERSPVAVTDDPVALRRFADVVTRLIISLRGQRPRRPARGRRPLPVPVPDPRRRARTRRHGGTPDEHLDRDRRRRAGHLEGPQALSVAARPGRAVAALRRTRAGSTTAAGPRSSGSRARSGSW